MDSGESPKTYKLPIIPASPCDALQGKKVTQQMIDSALAYDSAFRPSYIYLNDTDAHNNAGKKNGDSLALINRTFTENGYVVAEVTPNRKYKGEKFEELAAADGTHPGRSIDLWPKTVIPGCKSDFYLEGVALCGAQKPATVNLPAIYYSAETETGILTFSINTSSEMTTMPEDKKEDPKVDFAVMQKQLNDLETKVAKQEGDIQTLSTERDHYKTESETLAKGYKELKNKSDRQEIESLLDSQEYRGKFKADERNKIIEMALSMKDEVIALSTGETRLQAYMESIKNRPIQVNFSVIGGHIPNQIPAGETLAEPNDAIVQFATKNNLDLQTEDGWNKAEAGARKEHPELFRAGVK